MTRPVLAKRWTPETIHQIQVLAFTYRWGVEALAREFGTTKRVIKKVLWLATMASTK